MRSDYTVLTTTVRDEISSFREVRTVYVEGGFDGVYLTVEHGAVVRNLEFLRELPGIKYVEVKGKVIDDTAAFTLPHVEEVILLTRSKAAIPEVCSVRMRRIGIDDRPGKERLVRAAELEDLAIWLFNESDLTFLAEMRALKVLRIEGMGQQIAIDVVEGCAGLTDIELTNLTVDSLRPLRPLNALRRLWIIGNPRREIDACLDLVDVAGLHQLEEIRITYAGKIKSLASLTGLDRLKEIRIPGMALADDDVTVLEVLRRGANVVGP